MTNHRGTTGNSEGSSLADHALIDKVRKLLAMAERTANHNEADAFSRKAAELIAEHRLDPERLRAPDPHDQLSVRTFELGRGAYVRARLALLQAVATAHGCSTVFRTGYHGTTALVAGYASDLETTELLYTSLHAQASARMSAERRSTGAATQQWRRSFLFGYAHQVGEMLGETTEHAETIAAGDGSSLPALRARERRVEDYAARTFGRVVSARPVSAPTATGYVAGRAAASRADVGRTMVPGSRAIGRGS
jgi:hypothetical protein